MSEATQPPATATGATRPLTIAAVYLSALLQGIALILYPAAGALFTDPAFHNLSDGQFGILFIPQIIGAIATSLSAASLARRFGMKRVLQIGLAANVAAMGLMAVSQVLIGSGGLAFAVLLLGTASIGAGFGLTITALNAYAFDLFRTHADAAVTALHVMAGIGQAAAALGLSFFRDAGFWWGAPLGVGVLLAGMFVLQVPLALRLSNEGSPLPESSIADQPCSEPRRSLSPRIWLYALVAFLYGACEATFGNWSPIYLEDNAGLTPAQAAQALALFWGMVTLGRVLFALAAVWLRPQVLYLVVPFVVAISLIGLPLVEGIVATYGVLALGGLGLSFFFPLSISLASAEQPDQVDAVSGAMVGGIQLGVGTSAILVGQVIALVALPTIFQLSSIYALLMGGLVIYLALTKPRTQPVR